MGIDWKKAQSALTAAGTAPGPIDGIPGRSTYSALMGYVAGRRPDAIIMSMATEMAKWAPVYGIDGTPQRLADFLAQTAHESTGYSRFEEGMRYSAKRLMQVWPSRFPTLASALPYVWDSSDPDREDVALANKVYGGRMGNELDGTDDNDGWDHRGSGILQHTGAGEYAKLKERLGYDPDDVRDPAKSVRAAMDYWQRRGVNGAIDAGQFKTARKRVNGGLIGYDDIAAKRAKALRVLA